MGLLLLGLSNANNFSNNFTQFRQKHYYFLALKKTVNNIRFISVSHRVGLLPYFGAHDCQLVMIAHFN